MKKLALLGFAVLLILAVTILPALAFSDASAAVERAGEAPAQTVPYTDDPYGLSVYIYLTVAMSIFVLVLLSREDQKALDRST